MPYMNFECAKKTLRNKAEAFEKVQEIFPSMKFPSVMDHSFLSSEESVEKMFPIATGIDVSIYPLIRFGQPKVLDGTGTTYLRTFFKVSPTVTVEYTEHYLALPNNEEVSRQRTIHIGPVRPKSWGLKDWDKCCEYIRDIVPLILNSKARVALINKHVEATQTLVDWIKLGGKILGKKKLDILPENLYTYEAA